jgi:hypothetical protein
MCVLLMVGIVGITLSCGAQQPGASLCAPGDQTLLLDLMLTEWTPSTDFTVSPNTTVWIGLTTLPVTYGGPFGDIGPVADLHPIHAGATPAIVTDSSGNKNSTDPIIELQNDQKFRKASIGPGTWQMYSNTDPGIRIVSCPGSG